MYDEFSTDFENCYFYVEFWLVLKTTICMMNFELVLKTVIFMTCFLYVTAAAGGGASVLQCVLDWF